MKQKKSVPKEMEYEVCILKSTGQVGQYKSLRYLWNVVQDFSVAFYCCECIRRKDKSWGLNSVSVNP